MEKDYLQQKYRVQCPFVTKNKSVFSLTIGRFNSELAQFWKMASHQTYTATLHHMFYSHKYKLRYTSAILFFFKNRFKSQCFLIKIKNGSQMFCPQKISEKWKIKVYEVVSVPPCCHLLTLCAAVRWCGASGCVALHVRVSWLSSVPVAPLCHAFGLGSSPGYPPAGNCVPLSCLAVWF